MKLAFRPAAGDELRCLCNGPPSDSPTCSPIVSLWSSSYKRSHYAGLIWHEDWAAVMHPQIQRALQRPTVRTLIAYEKSDPDFFYGFITADTSEATPVVYYVYVKESYRRQGIARALFAAAAIDPSKYFVHVCKTGISATLSRKTPLARYNNLEARYPKEARTSAMTTIPVTADDKAIAAAAAKLDKQPKPDPTRQPIAVDKLLITHTNPHGVKLPDGLEGKGEKMRHSLQAGVEGDVKTDIEFRPWMRAFRVSRSQRLTRTENGKEVEFWKAMGRPFFIHETWAVWVPKDEA